MMRIVNKFKMSKLMWTYFILVNLFLFVQSESINDEQKSQSPVTEDKPPPVIQDQEVDSSTNKKGRDDLDNSPVNAAHDSKVVPSNIHDGKQNTQSSISLVVAQSQLGSSAVSTSNSDTDATNQGKSIPKSQNDIAQDADKIERLDPSINSDKHMESLMFEEVGDLDESLVEQVKRLSKKIAKGEAVPVQMNMFENDLNTEAAENLETEESHSNVEDMTFEKKELFVDTDKGSLPEEKILTDNSGDKIESHSIKGHVVKENVPNIGQPNDLLNEQKASIKADSTTLQKNEHIEIKSKSDLESDGSLSDKMKILGQKLASNAPDEVIIAEEDDAFPEEDQIAFSNEDQQLDENGKSLDARLKASVTIDIANTPPPVASLAPSETNYGNSKLKTDQTPNLVIDKTAYMVTPTPSVVQNQMTDSVVRTHQPATAEVHENVDTSQNDETERLASHSVIASSDHTQEADASILDIKATAHHFGSLSGSISDLNIEPSKTVQQYQATVHDKQISTNQIDPSKDLPTGTVHETRNDQQPVVSVERDSSVYVRTETSKTTMNVKEAEAPLVAETTAADQPSTPQDHFAAPEESPAPPEETPEEKQRKQKAQEYFEQGEKLVNNSYKKDFLQAYEWFKLAADLGHSQALEYIGFGHLLGDYINLDPKKALKIFQELSDKGSPRGQLGLGFSYSAGLAVNSSQAKALIYFTFSALGGDPLAQMVLGYRYLSGIGVESKCETALQFYRKVATTVAENTSAGSPVIQRIRLHEQAENKENAASLMDEDLLQYYQFLADKGDVQAQVVLGQLYYQGGRGVPINHERAHHYFLMAAESANANALAFLGKMHSEGSPVIIQDNKTAFQYFTKAAEKGNPIGQSGLGVMYLYGKGVDKDFERAQKYFTLSADQGWSDGQLHLGIMHFSGKGVRRDYKMAVKYFNLASQGGHLLGFYHLAQMHATGTGVRRNCHTAVELYKNVAERGASASMLMEAHQLYKEGSVDEALLKYTFLAELGYEVAQTNVAYILDQGECGLFNEQETYQRALLHWTRAASQGSTVARLKMGDYHYYGYGTDIDYETAATHYRLATEQQHNAQAMFNLGYMHENGLGLKQDVHLAKRFYDMAAETSGDAYIPVTLALFKLGIFYGSEVFNKELETYYQLFNKMDVRYQLGPNWDIYLATFLAIVLGIIVVIRRQR